MKLDNTVVAVVTGGASGLGAATVRALAARGARVSIFDLNEAQGQALAAEVGGAFFKVDVTSDASVEEGFLASRATFGQERVLVNCAGTGNAIKTAFRDKTTGEIGHFPLDAFERIVQINLMGTFRALAKSAAGLLAVEPLEDGERGVIVNTSSVAAQDGQIGQAAYAASKGAVVAMTLPIARDLANDGIRINTIMPGIFDTPLLKGAPQPVLDALGASVPFPKRLGRVEEFAAMVVSIVENGYMNGASLRLDGAIRMTPR